MYSATLMQVRCLEHADGVVGKGASELFPSWEGCVSAYTLFWFHHNDGFVYIVPIRWGTRTQLYDVPIRDRGGAILFPSGEGCIYTCYQGVVIHLHMHRVYQERGQHINTLFISGKGVGIYHTDQRKGAIIQGLHYTVEIHREVKCI